MSEVQIQKVLEAFGSLAARGQLAPPPAPAPVPTSPPPRPLVQNYRDFFLAAVAQGACPWRRRWQLRASQQRAILA
jgi:hypothetical protein